MENLTMLDKILYGICFVLAPLYIIGHIVYYFIQAWGV